MADESVERTELYNWLLLGFHDHPTHSLSPSSPCVDPASAEVPTTENTFIMVYEHCVHAEWGWLLLCSCGSFTPPMGFVRTTKSERQVDMTVDGEQLKQQQLGKRISSPPTFISAQCAKVQLFAIHAEKTTWMFLRSGKSLPLSASKSHTSNETYVHTNVQVCRIIRAPAFDINPWDSRKKSKRRFHLIFYYS